MSVTNNTPAVESRSLGKRFGSLWAARDVDLLVEQGVIYGFLGRNGAGKTTIIRLLLGLLHPTTGEVRIFGHDVASARIAAARQAGALLEARATYDQLTGRENLDTTRRLLDLPATEIDRVLEAVDMRAPADRKMGHYSLGMRQRLGLARAMLGAPRLLVLDEPMNGLDPDGIREMRAIIQNLPETTGATVLMSSHLLAEVQQTATHIGLMHDGRLMLQGAIGDMLGLVTPDLFIRTNNSELALRVLVNHGAIAEGAGLSIKLKGGDAEAAHINRQLIDAGLDVVELSLRQTTLETLYVQVQQQAEAA